jgi:hypothetical protein
MVRLYHLESTKGKQVFSLMGPRVVERITRNTKIGQRSPEMKAASLSGVCAMDTDQHALESQLP